MAWASVADDTSAVKHVFVRRPVGRVLSEMVVFELAGEEDVAGEEVSRFPTATLAS